MDFGDLVQTIIKTTILAFIKKMIGYASVQTLLENLTTEIPYLKDAIKSFQVTSVERTKDSEVISDLIQFSSEIPYVAEAFSSVQLTNVGRVYDLTEVANGKTVTTSKKEVYEQMEMKVDKDNSLYY